MALPQDQSDVEFLEFLVVPQFEPLCEHAVLHVVFASQFENQDNQNAKNTDSDSTSAIYSLCYSACTALKRSAILDITQAIARRGKP
jgi:hypothetical protein